jgi:hypothetical protein
MKTFRRERRRAARRRELPRISWGDLGAWLVAFATAIGLWLFVNTGERMSERTLRVRLEPENLPDGLVVTNPVAEFAEVRVSGPGVILSGIDPKRLRTPLDLSGVRPGVATYAINPKMFQFPRKVEVMRVTPSQVSLHVDRMARRTLPVRLDRQGEVPAGYSVSAVEVTPDKVEISGPATKLEGLRAIATEPLDFSAVGESGSDVYLRLVAPAESIQLSPAEVLAHVEIAPVVAEREFKAVPVAVRGGDDGWKVEPKRIAVAVRGPESSVSALELGPGSVYVDPADLAPPGPHKVRPSVVLPDGVEVVRQIPEEVSLQVASVAKKRGAPARKAESKRE